MEPAAPTDAELLADWLADRRESSFHALVSRYAALVHMAAKRACDDDSLAAEASQLTFILLARKARSLSSRTSLGGWLHLTAVGEAKNLLRASRREARKRTLLRTAMDTRAPALPDDDSWREIQPLLNDALAALSAKDREAILLRFYRSLSVREIASTLGIATAAAQKRIDRATERLRGKLARRGVQAGGSFSATMFAGFASDAQAAGIAVSILTTNAVAASGAGTGAFAALATLATTAALKTTSFIPPLVAMTAAVVWIGAERRAISDVERESRLMRQLLSANAANLASTEISSQAKAYPLPTDWKELVSMLEDPAIRRQFQKVLEQMQADELVRSLREIAAIDLLQSDRLTVENMIMNQLIKIDPESALTAFVDRIGDTGPLGRLLPKALGDWMRAEPARCGAWFDEQIAAGRFRSRMLGKTHATRADFEASAIAVLMGSDPAAARMRLSALAEGAKVEVMRSVGTRGIVDAPRVFADLVREQLPESAHAAAISSQAQRLVIGNDYTRVRDFLDLVDATPTERAESVKKVVATGVFNVVTERKFEHEDLRSIREWIATQSPDVVGEVTGTTLGIVSIQRDSQMDYTQIVELVIQCHESGDGDALLIHFLENTDTRAEANQVLLRDLAERITDDARRAEILASLEQS